MHLQTKSATTLMQKGAKLVARRLDLVDRLDRNIAEKDLKEAVRVFRMIKKEGHLTAVQSTVFNKLLRLLLENGNSALDEPASELAEEIFGVMKIQGSVDETSYLLLLDIFCRFGTSAEVEKGMRAADLAGYLGSLKKLASRVETASVESAVPGESMDRLTPNIVICNTLLKSLSRMGKWEEAWALYEALKCGKRRISLATYRELLDLSTRRGVRDGFLDIASEMRKWYKTVDHQSYVLLLRGYCVFDDLPTARRILDECINVHSTTSPTPFTILMKAYSSRKRWENLIAIWDLMKTRNVRPDLVSYGVMIDGFAKAGNWQEVKHLWTSMLKSGCKPNTTLFTSLMHSLATGGQLEAAWEIYLRMRGWGMKLDIVTYTSLIHAFLKLGRDEKTLITAEHMRESNIQPNVHFCSAIIDGLAKRQKVDAAYDLLQDMRSHGFKPTVHSYTALIDGYGKLGDMEKAEKLTDCMAEDQVLPNVVTFTSLAAGYLNVRKWEKAKAVLEAMAICGIKPNIITCTILLSAFVREGSWENVMSLCQWMDAEGVKSDEFLFSGSLDMMYAKKLRRSRRTETIHRLMEKDYLASSVVGHSSKLPCTIVETILGEHLGVAEKGLASVANRRRRKDKTISDFSAMLTVLDMRSSVEQYRETNSKLDVEVYNKMLNAYCFSGKHSRAMRLWNLMRRTGSFNSETVSIVFTLCSQTRQPWSAYAIARYVRHHRRILTAANYDAYLGALMSGPKMWLEEAQNVITGQMHDDRQSLSVATAVTLLQRLRQAKLYVSMLKLEKYMKKEQPMMWIRARQTMSKSVEKKLGSRSKASETPSAVASSVNRRRRSRRMAPVTFCTDF